MYNTFTYNHTPYQNLFPIPTPPFSKSPTSPIFLDQEEITIELDQQSNSAISISQKDDTIYVG